MDGLKGSALVSPTQFAGLTFDWIQICSKYNIKSPPQKKITLNAKVVIFAQEKRKMAIAKMDNQGIGLLKNGMITKTYQNREQD